MSSNRIISVLVPHKACYGGIAS